MHKIQKTHEKYERLKDIIKEMGHVCVAFSGGTDSSFLLKTACDVLGNNHVLAVMLTGDMLLGFCKSMRSAVNLHRRRCLHDRRVYTEQS